MKTLGLATLLLCGGLAVAAPTAAPVRSEIDALLARLERSGCQFERNGAWHDGAAAKEHLLRKLGAIERRGSLASTEEFIELAASKSSTSGKSYRVQCASDAPVESRAWMRRELAALRKAAATDAR